jgi:hypothetical protein
MSWTSPETADWAIGLLMSTAFFTYYAEKKTGNVVWRTNSEGTKSISLNGLKNFIVAPLHKGEMWNSELLDQNYVVSAGISTPIMATASKIIRQYFG